MFEKYCIDTLRFLKNDKNKYYEIEYVLEQLGIDTSLSGAVRQDLKDRGFLTCHKQGCWINDRGIAYLAKIDFGDIDKTQLPLINTGTIFNNSPVSHSTIDFDFNQDHILPTNIPTPKQNEPYQKTGFRLASIMLWISDHIVQILVGVIATVLGGYILFRMGWLG